MTLDTSLTAALGIGFLLGLRHATDADHIAAVSTFVSRDRRVIRSCLVGTCWGAGHTLAVLVAGLATIVFKLTISAEMEKAFETTVALVLILLGGHAVLRSLTPVRLHRHEHSLLELGGRPFLVGLLHGLAGSAALTLLVLATIPRPLAGLLYIAVFGVGSTAGMLILSVLIAVPFVLTAGRSDRWNTAIRAAAGTANLILGIWLVWPVGA
jgi:high-affinity nickel-transport protein